MMYTATEKMSTTVHEYLAAKAKINQLQKAVEELEAKIKSFMDNKGIEVMAAGDHTVTYKPVVTSRLDTSALKKDFDQEVLETYMVLITSKRFTVK